MDYQELRKQYRELDRDCALFQKNIQGYGEEELNKMFIPDNKAMDKAWKDWNELKNRVETLPEQDGVFSLIKHHLEDFMDSLKFELESTAKSPEGYFLRFNWSIDHASRISRKSDKEKCEELVSYLDNLRENSSTLIALIKERSTEKALGSISSTMRRESLTIEEERKKISVKFSTFTPEQCAKLEKAMDNHCKLLISIAEEFATENTAQENIQNDDLTKIVKLDVEEYRGILEKRLGVSLNELLDWHKQEIDKTRSEVFEIASKLNIEEPAPKTMREVNDILYRYEGPCDTPEEMLSRANEYLKRTRALAHEFVKLPEDEFCRCAPISECCKDSYPWGGYEGGDFSIRPFRGQMFLNNYNYKNVTDGWIKLNALHEAYPGHHVQYVKTAISETPETVKIGAKLVPILEGTCLRTERAFEFIFGEDPFFPLFVAYRRHHASVRIYIDLMLFYFGKTLEDAVKTYEEELGFERGTARKQVQAHENSPGYFTCYYYGMKKLCEWEKKYGFNKKDYTELLFSAGYISIDRFEELLKLTEEERERYLHDFCSLLKKEFKQE